MLRYLSLFSGIGAFEKALTNLGVKYEVVNYCEIDKYASKSYSAIHGVPESKNLWDITKVNVFNLPKDIDLLTYGFPCQDISLAGKQKGMFNEDGSLTRSGLFFKALDVIEYVKPKVAIAENVKALTSKKFTEEFKTVLDSLEKAGYNNYWKVLNAKDYGIPQNRERVFIVSIRKDIDHELFEFPKPYSLEKRLKDFLEPHVDEKYYLSDKMVDYFKENSIKNELKGNGFRFKPANADEVDISKTITTRNGSRMDDNFITMPEKTKKGCTEATDGDGVYINRPEQKRGVVQKGMIQTIKTSPDIGVVVKDPQCYEESHGYNKEFVSNNGVCRTLRTTYRQKTLINNGNVLRIRKLTPKECYRLMGFSDEDFEKSEAVPTSNTQLYKQAGNSIVVDVLEEIMCMMLDTEDNLLV